MNWVNGPLQEYDEKTLYFTKYRKDGWRVIFFEYFHNLEDGGTPFESPLEGYDSPTDYSFEIRVKKVEIDPELFVRRIFPSADTDLSLEEKVFTQWPTEYFPEGFVYPKFSV